MELDAARKAAGLNPLPTNTTKPDPKPTVAVEDATIGNEERLRGIPAVGRVSGTIKGTRPGDSATNLQTTARELNEHARLILRDRLRYRT